MPRRPHPLRRAPARARQELQAVADDKRTLQEAAAAAAAAHEAETRRLRAELAAQRARAPRRGARWGCRDSSQHASSKSKRATIS